MYKAKTIVPGIEFHAKSNRKCSSNDRNRKRTVPPQQLTEENAATALHRYKSSSVNVLLNGAIRRPLNDSIIFRMINFEDFLWKFFDFSTVSFFLFL